MATDLVIGIGAEYIGKPAFDKANKSIFGLGKSVDLLAKRFTGLYLAQKAFAYSKESVKAFNQDNQSAKLLTQSLNNLGLAFEDDRVKTLIANLESVYKVADDELRPAFQKLVQVTGSVNRSQDILKSALNLSAGAGTDLGTAVQALSQAYVGNVRGLKQFNLGLTNAELQGKSFAQIMEVINKKFASQALQKASDPLNALSLAANNAKEVIGKGLVDALSAAAGGKEGLDGLVKTMGDLAKQTSDVLTFVGKIVGAVNKIGKFIGSTESTGTAFSKYTGTRQTGNLSQLQMGQYPRGGGKALDTAAAARKKAEDAAIKRNKELLALANKQTKAAADLAKAKREQAILDKVNQIFNMDIIQNIAAMQGKITDEEGLRLKTQYALLTDNAKAAGELGQKLLYAQEQALLARQADPFNTWTKSAQDALKAIQDMIAALKLLQVPAFQPYSYQLGGLAAFQAKVAAVPDYELYASPWQFGGMSADKVTANVSEVGITLSFDQNSNLTASLQNQSISGTPANISRVNALTGGYG